MKKGLKRTLIILGSVTVLIGGFIAVCNIIPPKKVTENNLFLRKEGSTKPMLAAHRGGSLANPENTLKAYKAAVNEFNIDIVESDIWMTKDEHLVYSHDKDIDRMSDVALFDDSTDSHLISDYTLDELENFNFGYNFKDKQGNYPYKDLVTKDQADRKQVLKDNDLQILEVDKLFEQFYTTNPDLMFIVEIKNGGELGFKAATLLDELLTNKFPNYKDKVVVGTFKDEISKDLKENHPTILRGASTGEATKFVVTQMFGVNIFDDGDFVCLQIPTKRSILHLDRKTFVRRAHRRNMAVQYWTINDAETMKDLNDLGCDCIMTDDPELFNETFK